ncbi:MAG: hypothetical protein V1809_11860 [Planctomycetota bacterium]
MEKHTHPPDRAAIARPAGDLREKDGGPHGRDPSYGFKAEQVLKACLHGDTPSA